MSSEQKLARLEQIRILAYGETRLSIGHSVHRIELSGKMFVTSLKIKDRNPSRKLPGIRNRMTNKTGRPLFGEAASGISAARELQRTMRLDRLTQGVFNGFLILLLTPCSEGCLRFHLREALLSS